MIRAAIVAEARSWIDTPHVHQACIKGVGCDCIGVIVGTGLAMGFASAKRFLASGYRNYASTPDPMRLRAALPQFLVPCCDPLPGDVLLMSFAKLPHHFGILSEPEQMVHAYQPLRRVVAHRIDERWRRRIVGAFRYMELA